MSTIKTHKDDHRDLIQIWIREEADRRQICNQEPDVAIDEASMMQIERMINEKKGHPIEETIRHADELLVEGFKALESKREKPQLPSRYEREVRILEFQRSLSHAETLILKTDHGIREDIFATIGNIQSFGDPGGGENVNHERQTPGPVEFSDVGDKIEGAISRTVTGSGGKGGSWSAAYWRSRITAPAFDTSRQLDRRLVITPYVALVGNYSLCAGYVPSGPYKPQPFGPAQARVRLRFLSGICHWHWAGNTFEPEWSGWRASSDLVNRSITQGNIHCDIRVNYPGSGVSTPDHFDPPGVMTQPNPINNYAIVKPFDVVDFYLRPELLAYTQGFPSMASLAFSLLDCASITVRYEEGYLL